MCGLSITPNNLPMHAVPCALLGADVPAGWDEYSNNGKSVKAILSREKESLQLVRHKDFSAGLLSFVLLFVICF